MDNKDVAIVRLGAVLKHASDVAVPRSNRLRITPSTPVAHVSISRVLTRAPGARVDNSDSASIVDIPHE